MVRCTKKKKVVFLFLTVLLLAKGSFAYYEAFEEDVEVEEMPSEQDDFIGVVEGFINVTLEEAADKGHVHSPYGSVITNDKMWYDNKGKGIMANRCGTISNRKIDGMWYMVGSESHKNWKDGGNVFLYKSHNLGSYSWKKVKKVYDFGVGTNQTSSGCNINQRYDDPNTVIIHCRRKMFISTTGVEGDYYPSNLDVKYKEEGRGKLKIGSSSIYREGNDLWLVTTRIRKDSLDYSDYRPRFAYIYKLNSTWTGVEEVTADWVWDGRESPMIAKKGKWYYIFVSGTQGWKDTPTTYRRASSLRSLAWAPDMPVMMHPPDTATIKSHGTQFCYFQDFGVPGQEKFIFGGRRHPAEMPEHFAWKYGKFVMAPGKIIDGVPHVFFKYYFNMQTYDFNNPDSDPHYNFGHGMKKVPCVDSTEPIWLEEAKRSRRCGWAAQEGKTYRRCQKHRELQVQCPVACKQFGCAKWD